MEDGIPIMFMAKRLSFLTATLSLMMGVGFTRCETEQWGVDRNAPLHEISVEDLEIYCIESSIETFWDRELCAFSAGVVSPDCVTQRRVEDQCSDVVGQTNQATCEGFAASLSTSLCDVKISAVSACIARVQGIAGMYRPDQCQCACCGWSGSGEADLSDFDEAEFRARVADEAGCREYWKSDAPACAELETALVDWAIENLRATRELSAAMGTRICR